MDPRSGGDRTSKARLEKLWRSLLLSRTSVAEFLDFIAKFSIGVASFLYNKLSAEVFEPLR